MLLDFLIRKSDFSALLKFVSPHFFKVVSTKSILQMANTLLKNQADRVAWEKITEDLRQMLKRYEIGVRLNGTDSKEDTPFNSNSSLGPDGQALRLFFLQILQRRYWVLDFRGKSFSQGNDGILFWSPSPFYYELSEAFVNSIRDLYCGYYLGDMARFDRSLRDLNLYEVKSTFLKHFGPDDQSKVQFKLADFQRTFAEIFQACSEKNISLKPEFFILGMLLLGLYEQLESTEKYFDVRRAFLETYQMSRE